MFLFPPIVFLKNKPQPSHITVYRWLKKYKQSEGNIHSLVRSPNLKIWQYSQTGRVRGISGNVDINAFLGAEEEFEKLRLGSE